MASVPISLAYVQHMSRSKDARPQPQRKNESGEEMPVQRPAAKSINVPELINTELLVRVCQRTYQVTFEAST